MLSPGLRIGYAISDPNTATALAALAEGTYLSPAPLCQAVAARCLAAGAVGAHIERVRDFLRPRHDAAVSAAREQLGDALLAVPDGGYYLAAHLRVDADEPALLAAAARTASCSRRLGLLPTRGVPAGGHAVRAPALPGARARGVRKRGRAASPRRRIALALKTPLRPRSAPRPARTHRAAGRSGCGSRWRRNRGLQLLAQRVVGGPGEHLEAQVRKFSLAVSRAPVLGQQRDRAFASGQAMRAEQRQVEPATPRYAKARQVRAGANSAIAASHAAMSRSCHEPSPLRPACRRRPCARNPRRRRP